VQKNGAEKAIILEEKILKLIKNENTISRKSIAEQLGIGTTTAYRYIESLKKRGFIERIGSNKGGYWKIKNKYKKTDDKIAADKQDLPQRDATPRSERH
jgi:predicted HTH transcriptional regulator